jgi:hypothetical protein
MSSVVVQLVSAGSFCGWDYASWASTGTAPASRSRAAGLGKTPTTSVRRLISLFSRSSGAVDQIFSQCATGKAVRAASKS